MIVSKHGTSYDTSDGTEQPHAASAAARPDRTEREEINRWEDDGPGPHAHAGPPLSDPQRKPPWSVLSLDQLKALLRRVAGRGPSQLPRTERDPGAHTAEEEDRRAAEYARGQRDRYRNAWENT